MANEREDTTTRTVRFASETTAATTESPRFLPLNSRRITGQIVRRLALKLELPTAGSVEDTRQLIHRKLQEMGHELMNVQVVLRDTTDGLEINLQDADGVFLKVGSPEVLEPGTEADGEDDEHTATPRAEEVDALREELEEVRAGKRELEEEVLKLQRELEAEKTKGRDLWRTSSAQLIDFDNTLAAKEEEIAYLKEQLQEAVNSASAVSHPSRTASTTSSGDDLSLVLSTRRRGN